MPAAGPPVNHAPSALVDTEPERERVAIHGVAASSPQASIHDAAVSGLTADARVAIDRAAGDDWFRSASFAATYAVPRAERVCFLTDGRGGIADACFYRETRRWRGLPEIHVLGRTLPAGAVIRHLTGARRPGLIHFPWLTEVEMQTARALHPICSVRPGAEDFLIELPSSPELYLQRLGRKTRKHLPYYLRRLQREWGDGLEFSARFGSGVTRELYEGLLDLNRQRMRQRRRESGWRNGIVEQRWPIVRERGLLFGVYCREKLAAGTLSFLQGKEAYLIAIAHHPELDALNPGSVALWLTIQHLIGGGFRRFHLMWGEAAYKIQLGGRFEQLYTVTAFSNTALAAVWRAWDCLRIPAWMALGRKSARRLAWEIARMGRTESADGAY